MTRRRRKYYGRKQKLKRKLRGFDAIQIDFLAAIDDNPSIEKTEATVPLTPPPPNHDGGVGSTMITKHRTTRPTYPQDWPAYNAAQFHEQEKFRMLLRELCDTIEQPLQKGAGRPRLPLSDVIFGIGLKVYSTMSGRRAMTAFRDAQANGLLDRVPSFTSTFRYLENPELTSLLKCLIERSAMPLRAVEIDFSVDTSGFSTSVYNRWFDYKWGKERKEAQWVKAHIMCGVKTNIVTSVEVSTGHSADYPQLPILVNTTAQTFSIQEVSADKAYSGRGNLEAIRAVGADPFVPFKDNTDPPLRASAGQVLPMDNSAWSRAYH